MAVEPVAVNASDPSVDGPLLAWHEPGAAGVLVGGGTQTRVGGVHPAVGGARLAVVRDGAAIDITHTSGPPFALTVAAPGADAVAVSASWVVWRAREGGRDTIRAAPLAGGSVVRVMRAADLGRPALDGDRVAFHVGGRSGGRIVVADLGRGRRRTVRRERRAQLLNPSLRGDRLLYVRAIYSRQELRVGPLGRRPPSRDRSLWSTVPTGRRDAGHEPGVSHHRHGHPKRLWRRPRKGVAATLWTTALAADAAYVTRLRQESGQPPVAELLRVTR
jgi:hypothetical protein